MELYKQVITSKDILDFIYRRFTNDCNWLNGNCYYFALILKNRFNGTIFYDVIDGHFATQIDGLKYDWNGIVKEEGNHIYIEWDKFEEYDRLQKQRIIRDCIL